MRKWFRRFFVVGWLTLTGLGAVSHTLVPGLVPIGSAWVEVFPHLRFGWVMFNRMPQKVSSHWVRFHDEEHLQGLAVLDPTEAIFYKDSRLLLNAMRDAAYVEHLCRSVSAAQGAVFVEREYDVSIQAQPLRVIERTCDGGVLSGGD